MANPDVAETDKSKTQAHKLEPEHDWAARYRSAQAGGAAGVAIKFPSADKGSEKLDDACKILGNCEIGNFSQNPGPRESKIDGQPERSQDAPAPSNLDHSRFSQVAKAVLDRIDTDHKGGVTKEELAKAVLDPSFKGEDAQALAALYKNFDQLQNYSGDVQMPYSRKILTAADLESFQRFQNNRDQNWSDAQNMKTWVDDGGLARFAGDKENLSRSDIQAALKDPKVSQSDKDMLKLVDTHYSELGHWYDFKGVNKDAIKDYLVSFYHADDPHSKLSDLVFLDVGNTYDNQRLPSHQLYATGDPKTSISINDVHQGHVGDCSFEASLGALALQHPERIANAIRDDGQGNYTVTFPGAPEEPITVKAPTDAELGLYNGAGNGGTWAAVMEKAYGQYLINHGAKALTPQDATDFQSESKTFKLLTGNDSDRYRSASWDAPTVEAALEKAFSSRPPKAVIAGIDGFLNSFFGIGAATTDDGFPKNHAYTITGFVPDGQGGGNITIRNPGASNVNGPYGVVTIPLNEFLRNFSDLDIEK